MIIGIIGGGQLARMLILAGYPLNQKFIILDPSEECPAGQIAPQLIGAYDDPTKLAALAHQTDIITFDFENVPAAAIETIQQHTPVYPPAHALSIAQDRLTEKTLFKTLGIQTPEFFDIPDLPALHHAIQQLGYPAILKTRRLGYDGKGQFRIYNPSQIETAWQTLQDQPAILEAFIPFDFEVSLLSVRNRSGQIAFYSLVHNAHQHGILDISIAPYQDTKLQTTAETYTRSLLEKLNYIGVLAVEFFVKNGELIANEMAPRVHNSGHWTIEGASTSQFENHLRAILDLPLGTTQTLGYSAMINFVSEIPSSEDILQIPDCHFHNYGKTPRPGRKLGHATLRAENLEELKKNIAKAKALRTIPH